MPNTNLASVLYKQFENRAVERICNDQALRPDRAVARLDRGVVEIDEWALRQALATAYRDVSRELRRSIAKLYPETSE